MAIRDPKSTHYELYKGTQAIDVIEAALTKNEFIGFLKGNALKYQLRLGKKDDMSREFEKIEFYTKEIKRLT